MTNIDRSTRRVTTSGQRFAEERKRLGFETREKFAAATGLRLNRVSQYEDLNRMSSDTYLFRLLADIGFDFRYWETGAHNAFQPVSPAESALLEAWRDADADKRASLLDGLGFSSEASVVPSRLFLHGEAL